MSEPADITEAVEGLDQAAPGAAPEPEAIDYDAKAQNMGWTPKENFKGDLEKWVDAETFVKRGEEFIPFLKANNKQLERKLHGLEKTIAKLAEHNARTDERARAAALRDLKAELAAAAQNGDADAVDQITDEISELKAAPKAKAGEDAFEETFNDWVDKNPWYEEDADMQAYAHGIGQKLSEAGVSREDQLKQVAERVRKAFPHKFENPRRREPGAVEGAAVARRSTGKTYSDLPPDAKATCDDFVKNIKGFTRDRYVKDFFGS